MITEVKIIIVKQLRKCCVVSSSLSGLKNSFSGLEKWADPVSSDLTCLLNVLLLIISVLVNLHPSCSVYLLLIYIVIKPTFLTVDTLIIYCLSYIAQKISIFTHNSNNGIFWFILKNLHQTHFLFRKNAK